ncbi:DUF1134 domain-containing protein [Sphingomonas nostoxanthinifaciens]|uniref:DUF1134 domain-containing protein n=1 Tax=Sphingomonas nostoxanthinifaciens TaxID=2872652 RepID=UPI001CC1FE9D|nr:DUF1134 domain-containing protein [Sphingomonas nostoxanthinifaciens]
MRIGAAVALAGMIAAPVGAQVRTIDPNQAPPAAAGAQGRPVTPPPAEEEPVPAQPAPQSAATPVQPEGTRAPPPATSAELQARADAGNTYAEQDVLGAAEGVFGKGAAGLAGLIEKVFKDQGRPSAYISGREAGGAFVVGLRYGSGTLYHKVEGQRPVYWTGPSLGFDFGANGAKEFVLVYNLYDAQELYRRFPAVEGVVYVIGGFTASYLRSGDKVLIPIRLGVGWRLGANIGYMKFTEKSKWMPF